ncbi:hypothetical protein [Streptodolium elevatio]|uniref:Uncharacterized protein n=1 Tax=Streptodolium elevatio TaxID=3157996 RepID=A0ABV3DJZ0_9ACTN
MHTDDTPVCPRHTSRHGTPVWCTPCTDQIRTALVELPALHAELDQMYGTTPRRADRRATGNPPPMPRREFGLADEIARALDSWARLWADHLSENPPEKWNPLNDPVDISAKPIGLYTNRAELVWERLQQARAYHDLHHRSAPRPVLRPRIAARYLNAHRTNIDILATPGARPLGEHLQSLWSTARNAVPANQPQKPKTTHRRCTGVCEGCDSASLYRTSDDALIHCWQCPRTMTEDEYRAYAQRVKAVYSGAA